MKLFPSLEAAFEDVFNRVLTELRLDWIWNNIGAQGTIAIAEALKVNAVLTELSLWTTTTSVQREPSRSRRH